MNNQQFRNIFLILCMLLVNFRLFAKTGLYPKNYTKQEYLAASQNWSVTQYSKGHLYFANNIGLLEFDGITWTPLLGIFVRSVEIHQYRLCKKFILDGDSNLNEFIIKL